jgi:hypothetical protein
MLTKCKTVGLVANKLAEDDYVPIYERQPKKLKRPPRPTCPKCDGGPVYSCIDTPRLLWCGCCDRRFTIEEFLTNKLGVEWAATVEIIFANVNAYRRKP